MSKFNGPLQFNGPLHARSGEIKNYTGIDSPYEAPDNPELVIDTDSESLKESIAKVVDFLKSKEIID